MTKLSKEARIDRAQQLMQDPLLVEVFAEMEADIVARWKIARSAEDRENRHVELRLLETFTGNLKMIAVSDRIGAKK